MEISGYDKADYSETAFFINENLRKSLGKLNMF